MKQIKHGIVTFLAVLIIWQLMITVFQINPALFPSPAGVGKAFIELVTIGLKGYQYQFNPLFHWLLCSRCCGN